MAQAAPYTHRKYHFIYKTTCLVTGRWYIGMHSTNDLNDGYKGSGTHLVRSLKKHGLENHICEVLEHLQDRESLRKREEAIITVELLNDTLCMNKMTGGFGNDPGFWLLTEEERREKTLQKMSVNSKKMWAKRKADPAALAEHIKKISTPEIVAKRALANTGKKRTSEQKENLNKCQASYYTNANKEVLQERGKKSAATRKERGTNMGGRPKGIRMAEEQKARQSVQKKGLPFAAIARASCIHCRKETTVVAIKQFHQDCQ